MTPLSNHGRNVLYGYTEVGPLKYFTLVDSRVKMFPRVTEIFRVNLIPMNRVQNKIMRTRCCKYPRKLYRDFHNVLRD
jgi:hypothetical protein